LSVVLVVGWVSAVWVGPVETVAMGGSACCGQAEAGVWCPVIVEAASSLR
jgi:hypothetical protein